MLFFVRCHHVEFALLTGSALLSVALTLAVGALGWFIASKLGLSAPAMLGSMLAVGITNALFGYAEMPGEVRVVAQSVSGAFIAMSMSRKDVANMKRLIVPMLLLFAMFTVNTLVVGTVLHTVFGMNIYTALFGSVAGGIADISMIAMDFEQCDASEVAFLQTSRLVAVLLFFPSWITFMCRNEPEEEVGEGMLGAQSGIETPPAVARIFGTGKRQVVVTFVCCLCFGIIGKLSGMPAGTIVFAMIGTAAINLSFGCCRMPMQTKRCAQLLAGSLVGSTIDSETFSNLASAVGPVVLLLVSYWIVNFVYSHICARFKLLDLRSAMFASAPGGASDMALIAADLGANLAKIATIQMTRAIYAVAVMPTVVLLFAQLFV